MLVSSFASSRSGRAALCALALFIVLFCAAPAQAQGDPSDAEMQRAGQLIHAGNFAAALPILERLIAANPNNGQAQFGLGYALVATTIQLPDSPARRQARVRARNALLRARALGVSNALLNDLIDGIPPDGSGATGAYSINREADAAMRQGETLFTRGDLNGALAQYEHAHRLDRQLYLAPLFAGDMLRKQQQWERAIEWFQRAIAINPEIETAHRWWGETLMAQGRLPEAREKLFDAILLDPYARLVWSALLLWSQRAGIQVGHPRIEQPPPSMQSRPEGDRTTITMDPRALEGEARYWMGYDLIRSTYRQVGFARDHPNESQYRHSLREEATALRVVAERVSRERRENRDLRLSPSLLTLADLHEKGLLEAYVLFARANEGIARDYAEYRRTNRDQLRRYLTEYVAPLRR